MGALKLLICTNIPLLQMFGACGGSNLKDIGTGEKVSSCKLLSIDSLVVQKNDSSRVCSYSHGLLSVSLLHVYSRNLSLLTLFSIAEGSCTTSLSFVSLSSLLHSSTLGCVW